MVIKLEELDRHSGALARRLGAPKAFDLHLNQGPLHGRDIRPLFTSRLQGIVQQVYARDFSRFRYDPDEIPAPDE